MSRQQIRANQLITTFGPGAMVDLPTQSIIVGGLEHWLHEKNEPCIVEEPRLAGKVGRLLKMRTIELRTPPPSSDAMFQKGVITPGVGGFIFPHWFIAQRVELSPQKHRRRRLVLQGELTDQGRFKDEGKSWSVVPVRFVRACRKGHVGDIQWREFSHHGQTTCQRRIWIEERGTTGDLSDVWIVCECNANRSMSEAAEAGNLGRCNGSRPWLDDIEPRCGEANRLLVRTASNAYFPQTLPVISIPNGMKDVEKVVLELWDGFLCKILDAASLAMAKGLVPILAERLAPFSDADVLEIMQTIRDGKPTAAVAKPVKEIEFDALADSRIESNTDEPDGDFFARTMDPNHWQDARLTGVEKIVLVHRIREVVALLGFTRFEPNSPDVTGELDINVERAAIARNSKWMPVAENRGEGIFIQLKTDAIHQWETSDPVLKRATELAESFQKWQAAHPSSNSGEFPGAAYIMLHSLSHLLISAISLECGYPLSSLRERIYAPAPGGQMADRFGILIFTASAGSEGTLGGLVAAARDIRKHLFRAMQLGTLCSNDPVCSTRGGSRSGVDRISGSACHGCLYISETSCERFNQFLDRALVVPTIERRGCEFLKI